PFGCYLSSYKSSCHTTIYTLSLHDALPISYYRGMIEAGVFLPPSQFEGLFLSTAHTEEDIEKTVKIVDDVFSISSSVWAVDRNKDRKSTRLNSSHVSNSYAVFCLNKKNIIS